MQRILREMNTLVSCQEQKSFNSNGRQVDSGQTILVSDNNPYEQESRILNEKQITKLNRLSMEIEEHLQRLPKNSTDQFIQKTRNNAHELVFLVKNLVTNKLNYEEHEIAFTQCNKNTTMLLNYSCGERTLLVNEKVKGIGSFQDNKKTYTKISNEINFADRGSSDNIISIDAGVDNRNAILLDRNSKAVNVFTEKLKSKLDNKEVEVAQKLKIISQYIYENLEKAENKVTPNTMFVEFENINIRSENLDDFISGNNETQAFCRHHSLLAAEVLGKLLASEQPPNDPYEVHHCRGTAYNLKAHSYVKINNGINCFLFDSTHPGMIYDLNNEKEKQEAINYYKSIGLDGLINKDPDAKISQSVLQHITSIQEDLLVEAGLTCPLSMELMLDPVTADGKIFYDRRFIKEWLKQDATCPLSRKKIELSDFDTEDNIKASKKKLEEIKTWLSENVILPEEATTPVSSDPKEESEFSFNYQNIKKRVTANLIKKNLKDLKTAYNSSNNDNDHENILTGLSEHIETYISSIEQQLSTASPTELNSLLTATTLTRDALCQQTSSDNDNKTYTAKSFKDVNDFNNSCQLLNEAASISLGDAKKAQIALAKTLAIVLGTVLLLEAISMTIALTGGAAVPAWLAIGGVLLTKAFASAAVAGGVAATASTIGTTAAVGTVGLVGIMAGSTFTHFGRQRKDIVSLKKLEKRVIKDSKCDYSGFQK